MATHRLTYNVVAAAGLSLASCSALNPPLANPVIVNSFDGNAKGVYTVATTADRRLVFVNAQTGATCMEAPPDATENVSSSLSATIAAALQTTSGVSPELKAAVATQIASALAHVTQPSQGILLYRFGMSNLCNRFLNGAIDAQEYKTYAEELLVVARELTYQELLATNGKIGPEVKTSEVPPTPTAANITGTGPSATTGQAQPSGGAPTSPSAVSSAASPTSPSSQSTRPQTPSAATATTPSPSASAATVNSVSPSDKAKLIQSIQGTTTETLKSLMAK